jgi:hypothetical protein
MFRWFGVQWAELNVHVLNFFGPLMTGPVSSRQRLSTQPIDDTVYMDGKAPFQQGEDFFLLSNTINVFLKKNSLTLTLGSTGRKLCHHVTKNSYFLFFKKIQNLYF